MLFEQIIREAVENRPDPLSVAKEKVQTRAVAAVIRERKAMVHAALRAGVPTEGHSRPAGRRVQA